MEVEGCGVWGGEGLRRGRPTPSPRSHFLRCRSYLTDNIDQMDLSDQCFNLLKGQNSRF